jgi:integrase/recombinase XerD
VLEIGGRSGEVVGLQVTDLVVTGGTAIIGRVKGGRGRVVPFGPPTARPLDRYLRVRAHHRLAATPAVYVNDSGKGFSYDELHEILKQHAVTVGSPAATAIG